ncbi:MAG: DUF3862 domain-containing protein [Pyrinomonadaceae bacterium]|nr:DUF3862 domain-containing protein [Pyrinomonadaceae bacterium]
MKNKFNLGLIVVVLVVLGCSCPKLDELKKSQDTTAPSSTPNGTNPSATPAAKENAGISMDKYNQLKNGMSYKQAVAVMGSEGEEMSSSEIGNYKTVSYKWSGDNFQFVFAVFQNDKMLSKSQSGLK